jgi:hypothetical protein
LFGTIPLRVAGKHEYFWNAPPSAPKVVQVVLLKSWSAGSLEPVPVKVTVLKRGNSRNDPITHLTSRHALTHLDHLAREVAAEDRGVRDIKKVLGMHDAVGRIDGDRHDFYDDVFRRRTRVGPLLDKHLVEGGISIP